MGFARKMCSRSVPTGADGGGQVLQFKLLMKEHAGGREADWKTELRRSMASVIHCQHTASTCTENEDPRLMDR